MYDVKNKQKNIRQNTDYTMAKILGMFKYSGLPDTIPQKELEKILLNNGYAFITEHNGELYAFQSSLGGELDAYYRPTKAIVANPWLKLNKEYNVFDDGVLMKNDSMQLGVRPLMEKWNTLMVENQITLNMQSINQRVVTVFSSSDDKTKESAEQFIDDMLKGEMSVIAGNAMFDGIQLHSAGQGTGRITDLIEYQQWLTSKLHTELGINDQGNMKRERLVSDEVRQSEEGLSILVDDMFIERQNAIELINAKYGTEISIDFDGVWKQKRSELEADLTINESIIENGGELEDQDHEQEEVLEVPEEIEDTHEEILEEVEEDTQEIIEEVLTDIVHGEVLDVSEELDTVPDVDSEEEPDNNDSTDETLDATDLSGDQEGTEEEVEEEEEDEVK